MAAEKILYLEQLFTREAHELYQDEVLLAEAFGLFRDAASNPVLGELFERLRRETQDIAANIQKRLVGKSSRDPRPALRGMLQEGQRRATDLGDHHLVDAELIATIQRLLGYQLAGYQNVANFSRMLREDDLEGVISSAIEHKRRATQQLSAVALHQVHWRANWWAPEHTSSWDRVKAAFRRDWEQTKSRFTSTSPPPGEQEVGDTLAQIAGQQEVVQGTFEADEPAFRYGYVAAQHYQDREWGPSLEDELRSNYGGLWEPARDNIRAGWAYARPETRRSIPLPAEERVVQDSLS